MKKFLRSTSFTIIVAILTLIVCIIFNQLRWSEENIKTRLMKDVSAGAKMEDVIDYIKNNGWTVRYVNEENGFEDQSKNLCDAGIGKLIHRNGYYSCVDDGNKLIKRNDQSSCGIVGGRWLFDEGYSECIVGSKSIRSDLGDHGIFLNTNVTVFWGFDQQGGLIDIWAWKTVDTF